MPCSVVAPAGLVATAGCAPRAPDAMLPRLPPQLPSGLRRRRLTAAAGGGRRAAAPAEGGAKKERGLGSSEQGEGRVAAAAWPLPEAATAHAIRCAAVVAAVCQGYAALAPAAHAFAEEDAPREWLPRRHHRRLDEWERTIPAVERVKAKAELKSPMEAGKDTISSMASSVKDTASEIQRNLQPKKTGEFTMSMKAAPTPVRKPWESQVNADAGNWAYLSGAVALGAVGWFALRSFGFFKGKQPKGKWVRDRTLGGKMVFIPDNPEGPSSAVGSTKAASVLDKGFDQEVEALQAEAAKWRDTVAAPKGSVKDDGEMPSWWDPPPYMWVPEERKETLTKQAKTLLKQAEDAKLAGSDYPLYTLVELQNKCAEGQVSVKTNTDNGRDAMLRLGMESAIDCVIRGSTVTIGGLNPGRFVAGLAQAIQVPEPKAKVIVNAAMAAKARNLLLGICAGFRTGNRSDIAEPLMHLAAIVTAFPLSKGSAEADMMAASIKLAATLEERQGVMRLLYQLAPDSGRMVAEMLGFDPDMVIPLLEEETSPGGGSAL